MTGATALLSRALLSFGAVWCLSATSHANKADAMPLALPVINTERCTGCGRCVAACPEHVLWLQAEKPNGMGDKHAVLHDEPGCTGCAKCVLVCPFDAIAMMRTKP